MYVRSADTNNAVLNQQALFQAVAVRNAAIYILHGHTYNYTQNHKCMLHMPMTLYEHTYVWTNKSPWAVLTSQAMQCGLTYFRIS